MRAFLPTVLTAGLWLALCAAPPRAWGAEVDDAPSPAGESQPADAADAPPAAGTGVTAPRSGETAGDDTTSGQTETEKQMQGEESAKQVGMYERLKLLADQITQRKFPAMSIQRAVPYVILSLFFIFFGYKVYRVSVILFMGSVFGQIGALLAPPESALWYWLGGAALGALVALPLEKAIFTFIGAVAGAVVGVLIGNLMLVNVQGILTAGTIGFLAGGGISFLYEKAVLIVGFSLWGAVLGTYSMMCLYLEKEAGDPLTVPPLVLVAMLIAAGVGISFQVLLDTKYGTDETGDGVPD